MKNDRLKIKRYLIIGEKIEFDRGEFKKFFLFGVFINGFMLVIDGIYFWRKVLEYYSILTIVLDTVFLALILYIFGDSKKYPGLLYGIFVSLLFIAFVGLIVFVSTGGWQVCIPIVLHKK